MEYQYLGKQDACMILDGSIENNDIVICILTFTCLAMDKIKFPFMLCLRVGYVGRVHLAQ